MALLTLDYFNRALGKSTAVNVLLPDPGVEGPFAVLYLLHGYSDDHTIWQRQTNLERYVAGLPLIVVMPDAGISYYCDDPDGMKSETAIVRDLVKYIDTVFHTRADRSSRCVGGLSMGGYGAAKFALKYPDVFCSAASHSGALEFAHGSPETFVSPKRQSALRSVLGEHPQGGPHDLFALASQLKPEERPALRIDCGTEDFLLEENRSFVSYLETIGFSHEYEEFPGGHEWSYWDLHVQEAIQFHRKVIGF